MSDPCHPMDSSSPDSSLHGIFQARIVVGCHFLFQRTLLTQGLNLVLCDALEGLMLTLKCQYFGHLMRRADSLEKTLILRKIEGRRRG